MPEPNNENELELLRRTNGELTAKNKTRKARIAELETANTDLQTKLGEATASLHRIQVEAPLKELATSMSPVPELWMEQLTRKFKVELTDGKLALLSNDGKPVADKDGNVVSLFDPKALTSLLCDGDDATAKMFRTITIGTRANGGGASASGSGKHAASAQSARKEAPQPAQYKFGLR